jgi:hypothetical protein
MPALQFCECLLGGRVPALQRRVLVGRCLLLHVRRRLGRRDGVMLHINLF